MQKICTLNNPSWNGNWLKWDSKLTFPYAQKNKENSAKNLERQSHALSHWKKKINCSADDGPDAEQQEYQRAKTEFCRIYDDRAGGAILRSMIRWIESGENQRITFLTCMERKNENKKTINELTVAGGAET